MHRYPAAGSPILHELPMDHFALENRTPSGTKTLKQKSARAQKFLAKWLIVVKCPDIWHLEQNGVKRANRKSMKMSEWELQGHKLEQIATNCVGGGCIVARLLHFYASSSNHFKASSPTWVRKLHWDPNRNDKQGEVNGKIHCMGSKMRPKSILLLWLLSGYQETLTFVVQENSMQEDNIWIACPSCTSRISILRLHFVDSESIELWWTSRRTQKPIYKFVWIRPSNSLFDWLALDSVAVTHRVICALSQ